MVVQVRSKLGLPRSSYSIEEKLHLGWVGLGWIRLEDLEIWIIYGLSWLKALEM